MIKLKTAVDKYIQLRQSLGYKLRCEKYILYDFVRYMKKEKTDVITIDHAITWAKSRKNAKKARWSCRLSAVRCFSKYYKIIKSESQIIPDKILSFKYERKAPYIYTDKDVINILNACNSLYPKNPIGKYTYKTLLGLISVTGMRISEAIALQEDDINFKDKYITVNKSKFNKSRIIPVSDSVIKELKKYQKKRDNYLPEIKKSSFFISVKGGRPYYSTVQKDFRKIIDSAGLNPKVGGRRQRIHDFRHTLAVRVLLMWYRNGDNVSQKMPILSTYLGHVEPRDTYWYLSAVPELMKLTSQKLEIYLGGKKDE